MSNLIVQSNEEENNTLKNWLSNLQNCSMGCLQGRSVRPLSGQSKFLVGQTCFSHLRAGEWQQGKGQNS